LPAHGSLQAADRDPQPSCATTRADPAGIDQLFIVRVRRLLRSPRAIKLANRWGAGMMAGAATAMATR